MLSRSSVGLPCPSPNESDIADFTFRFGNTTPQGSVSGWYKGSFRLTSALFTGGCLPVVVFEGGSWHGNHHAFPHSAKLGIEKNQSDLGYAFNKSLEYFWLATDIRGSASEPSRTGLVEVVGERKYPVILGGHHGVVS